MLYNLVMYAPRVQEFGLKGFPVSRSTLPWGFRVEGYMV